MFSMVTIGVEYTGPPVLYVLISFRDTPGGSGGRPMPVPVVAQETMEIMAKAVRIHVLRIFHRFI